MRLACLLLAILVANFIQITSCYAEESIALNALPINGRVVMGVAKITQFISNTHPVLTIDQASDRAVIEWDDFSLGRNAIISLIVPKPTSSTLMRVVGSSNTEINGKIHSNGQLILSVPPQVKPLLP
jgi:large exoprotein involved in heme utilization and adhesion